MCSRTCCIAAQGRPVTSTPLGVLRGGLAAGQAAPNDMCGARPRGHGYSSGLVRDAAWRQGRPPYMTRVERGKARQGENSFIYINVSNRYKCLPLQYNNFEIFLPYSTVINSALIRVALPPFVPHTISAQSVSNKLSSFLRPACRPRF